MARKIYQPRRGNVPITIQFYYDDGCWNMKVTCNDADTKSLNELDASLFRNHFWNDVKTLDEREKRWIASCLKQV